MSTPERLLELAGEAFHPSGFTLTESAEVAEALRAYASLLEGRADTEAGVVQATFWTCSNCNADNNRDDYHRISCPHCGKLRPPVEPPAAHEWLAVDGSIPSPDFQVWGFHTGKQVEYRTENGTEHVGPYQGYGLFGPNLEATHWRPVTKGDR